MSLITVDCEWEYGEYTECSVTCGGGIKYRDPIITVHPKHGGKSCPPEALEEDSAECNTMECPSELLITAQENFEGLGLCVLCCQLQLFVMLVRMDV